MGDEGSCGVAFCARSCAGLVQCGECLLPVEGVVAGDAADDVEEGGAWVPGAVGQVLECPCGPALWRRAVCGGGPVGGDILVGHAGYGPGLGGADPGTVLSSPDIAVRGVLPQLDPDLVPPAARVVSPGVEPCPDFLTVREHDHNRRGPCRALSPSSVVVHDDLLPLNFFFAPTGPG